MNKNKNKTRIPGIRLKIYVKEDMIGGGKLELLQYVRETGSISAAAKKMGVEYKRAWFLLDTMQRCFEKPLFETIRGRGSKSGTTVTNFGLELIKRYWKTDKQVRKVSSKFLSWLKINQKS